MVEAAARAEHAPDERWADFDEARWRSRMQQSDIADELFMPLGHGEWQRSRFRLIRGERAQAKTRITGVRYLPADPAGENLEPERAVQNDFRRLVESLIKLRRESDWSRLSLADTFPTSPRFGRPHRRQFGIVRGAGQQPDSDQECAKRSYAAIRRSIRRAGFVVVDPQQAFDPQSGLVGLRDWVGNLRLRKRRLWWLWLLLLPLFLLVPRCESEPQFFGAPIETRSFVLLIDRSSSMLEHFDALRAEAYRLLEEIDKTGDACADVISYCGQAESALGTIEPVDETTRLRLARFLRELAPGGGTVLQTAIDLAAAEVRAHAQPTTLIVLTDASDSSIAQLVRDRDATRAGFGDVEIHSIAMTPRLFGPDAEVAVPQSDDERHLSELAELLGGRFGAAHQARPQQETR